MNKFGDKSSLEGTKLAFFEAEHIVGSLHNRITDAEVNPSSPQYGKQTLGDLQEFAKNGLGGLCMRIGIPQEQTKYIMVAPTANAWLTEVVLQLLFYSLFMMGQGPSVNTVLNPLFSRFGQHMVESAIYSANALAEEYVETLAQLQETKNPVLKALLNAKLSENVQKTRLASSADLENAHQNFTRNNAF